VHDEILQIISSFTAEEHQFVRSDPDRSDYLSAQDCLNYLKKARILALAPRAQRVSAPSQPIPSSSSSTPPFLNDEEMKVVSLAIGHLYSILGEVRRHVESTKQTASTFRADSVEASILSDEISIDILVAAVQKMPELCYMGFQDPELLYSEQELRLGFRTMVGISAGDRISSAVLHYHHEPVDTLNTFKEYSIDFAGTK